MSFIEVGIKEFQDSSRDVQGDLNGTEIPEEWINSLLDYCKLSAVREKFMRKILLGEDVSHEVTYYEAEAEATGEDEDDIELF